MRRSVLVGCAVSLALVLLTEPATAQVEIDFSTEEASVQLRFSNPWHLDPSVRQALAEVDVTGLGSRLRPTGRVDNRGREPVLVILFVQSPVGFPYEPIRLEEVGKGFSLDQGSDSVLLGGDDRPLWITVAVPSGGSIRLAEIPVLDPVEVARILIDGIAQLGVVVAAREGPVDVEIRDFSPLGPDSPDPADRGLLFPANVHVDGRHRLAAEHFSPSDTTPCKVGSDHSEPKWEEPCTPNPGS